MNMTFAEYANSAFLIEKTLDTAQFQRIFKSIASHPLYGQILGFNIDHLRVTTQNNVEIEAWCGCCTETCLLIEWNFTLTNPKTGNVGQFFVTCQQSCDRSGEYTFDNSIVCKLLHADKVKIEIKPPTYSYIPNCDWSMVPKLEEFNWDFKALSSNGHLLSSS